MTAASVTDLERVAEQWDTLRSGYFHRGSARVGYRPRVLRPEMTVVDDVGAGTGFMAARAAPLVSRVYVLDGSAPCSMWLEAT